MARPIKQGLDYFPMDVDLDDKFELIEAKHDLIGFAIIIKLFQRIYKEGYYLPLSDDFILLFSKRNNVDINKVNDVINDCLCYNIFDKNLHKKYKILTSDGIQKRYLKAVERRKEVTLDKNIINVDINDINADINWIDSYNSTQSKVKESKVNKIEERKEKFKQEIAQYKETYSSDTLKQFFLYWIEPNKSKTKMRFELEKTWDLNLRLQRWDKNNSKFGKQETAERSANRASANKLNGK